MDQQVPGTDIETQIRLLSVAPLLLKALGTKLLAFVTLTMTFGLFGWAMLLQRPLAFAIAAVFGFGTLWPVLLLLWKGNSP
jgi:hypothetical protein